MIGVGVVNATVGPAGLLAVLVVRSVSGERWIVTDAAWKVTGHKPDSNWRGAGFDDTGWAAAREATPGGPWGRGTPAVHAVTRLRREFSLRQARAERARLYVTALGLYEAYLNGPRRP
ncbi:hypothetical protein ACF09G_36665 [Streptomyces albogriseolus]|uniref:hypothetical protein n=1 Tax=Streptomyces TaxID=1883 RepID=UPI001E530C00|nr:hypothetical protein [Streptomyces sp. DH20]